MNLTLTDRNNNLLRIMFRRYQNNGRLAVELYDAEWHPYTTLSCNVEGVCLGNGEFCVKTWSENEYVAVDALQSGLFVDTGRRVEGDFVEIPIWRLSDHVDTKMTDDTFKAILFCAMHTHTLGYVIDVVAEACRQSANSEKDPERAKAWRKEVDALEWFEIRREVNTSQHIAAKFCLDYLEEHPEHSISDWQYAVANGDTRQSYWEWVQSQAEEKNTPF